MAYIRSLAELHGRNADWAAEAVRSAVRLPASEALKLGQTHALPQRKFFGAARA